MIKDFFKRKWRFNSISLKVGILFSSVFLLLFLLLGYMLYGLFSNLFVDYITQDLLSRGENHAHVLEENYNETTLTHVALMEQNVITSVVVTDPNHKVIIYSDQPDQEMINHLSNQQIINDRILNRNWEEHAYIVTVSPIAKGDLGYVYMFYPTKILNETVLVLQIFIITASFGIVLLAIGLISILSKKMTSPLLKMKEATNKMAKGDYKQSLDVSGQDELAQLGQSIQSLGEQLQYFEDTRNDFLAGVSHELRTPLTYIKGYSDILLKGFITDKQEQDKYLSIINDETKRVANLVNDLFDMSKIDTGQFKLNKEEVRIDQLIEKVVLNLSPLADKKGLKLSFHNNGLTPILALDSNRIEQVFFNLIENAVKYTEQGYINVSLIAEKNNVVIKIKDSGIGIPIDELSHIWDRFYRVEKSRARKTGGTGLGLYVVKEIIKLHGAYIDVVSEEGKGTTFVIKFRQSEVVA